MKEQLYQPHIKTYCYLINCHHIFQYIPIHHIKLIHSPSPGTRLAQEPTDHMKGAYSPTYSAVFTVSNLPTNRNHTGILIKLACAHNSNILTDHTWILIDYLQNITSSVLSNNISAGKYVQYYTIDKASINNSYFLNSGPVP